MQGRFVDVSAAVGQPAEEPVSVTGEAHRLQAYLKETSLIAGALGERSKVSEGRRGRRHGPPVEGRGRRGNDELTSGPGREHVHLVRSFSPGLRSIPPRSFSLLSELISFRIRLRQTCRNETGPERVGRRRGVSSAGRSSSAACRMAPRGSRCVVLTIDGVVGTCTVL